MLVDEAHNFRNVNRRSRGLRDYLESGDHKVVLLSATPQNLGPMDIYRQLRLFLDDTDHGLNIEPVSLEEYFRNAQDVARLPRGIRELQRRSTRSGRNVDPEGHHCCRPTSPAYRRPR